MRRKGGERGPGGTGRDSGGGTAAGGLHAEPAAGGAFLRGGAGLQPRHLPPDSHAEGRGGPRRTPAPAAVAHGDGNRPHPPPL